ncbi:hypothetical protein [Comamonas testosteroni]|uniref:Uncharacterized protein n=1 Tax=Comamonas testosteroni TaxID=285 RepID=A0A096FCS3_COMTE|nr:hypothetical protein [Comamonas testosteroni]KGH27744.1 hypothetical protein P353_17030 [Comamonas testosteroni]
MSKHTIPTELNIAPRGKSWLNGQLIDGVHGHQTRQSMESAERAALAATPAAAPAVPKWIDDPHDIEQGQMLNPEWVRQQQPAIMPKGESAAAQLRAMATNYPPGHSWDELDAKACIRGALEIEALRAVLAAATGLPAQAVVAPHPDDVAVDALAALMKAKLAKQRAKGYGGWDTDCTRERLSELLRGHVDKGDPVDVANFCAFLSARAEGITPQSQAEPVAWTVGGEVTNWSRDFSKYKTQHYVRPVFSAPMTVEDARAAELLGFLQDQCIDLRCFTTSDGEDVGWRTVQHHMSEPRERVVSEVYGDQPRRAIREAMARIERDPYCTGPLHLEDDTAIAAAKGE